MGLYYTPNPPHIGGAQPLEGKKLTPSAGLPGVVFDAQSNADVTGAAAASFSDSTKLTIAANPNRALLVGISWSTSTPPTGISITWDGVALTQLILHSNGLGGTSAIYGLLNPNPGTKTLAGSWTGARDFYVVGASFWNVDQASIATSFLRANFGIGTSALASVTIGTRIGNQTFAQISTANGAISSVNAGIPVFIDNTQVGTAAAAVRVLSVTNTSNVMTLNNTSAAWVAVGVDIVQVQPPPRDPPPFRQSGAILSCWDARTAAAAVLPVLPPKLIPPTTFAQIGTVVIFESQMTAPLLSPSAQTSFSDTGRMTVGNHPNRALIVVAGFSGSGNGGATLTWDGQTMTLLGSIPDGGFNNVAEIYGLLNPNVGTKTLAGSWGSTADYSISAASFYNVDQASIAAAFQHVTTSTGATSPATVTVASKPGNMVVASHSGGTLGSSPPSFTAVNNNEIYRGNGGFSPTFGGAANFAVGAVSVTLTATEGNVNPRASIGVDINPPGVPGARWPQEATITAWVPPAPAPIVGPKRTPPSGAVATFPFRGSSVRPEILAWTPAPFFQIVGRLFNPPVVGGNPPFAGTRVPTEVLNAWIPPAPAPIVAENLDPPIGATVDNPPFTGTEVPVEVLNAWIPPPPMPIVAVNLKPPISATVQNPPFVGAQIPQAVLVAWIPPPPAPILAINLDPPIAGTQDNPPFTGGAKVPLAVQIAWLPLPPAAIVAVNLTPPSGPVPYVPIGTRVPVEILNAWIPPPPAPILAINLLQAPAAPGFPPLGSFVSREILISWIPPAPAPIVAQNLNPPIGAVVNNPPFTGSVIPTAVLVSWIPAPPAPFIAILLPPLAAAPVLFGGARVPGEVLTNWIPPPPAPIVARNLTPPSATVDNPPFNGGARLRLEIQLAWIAALPGYPPLKAINKTPPSGGAVAPPVLHAKPFFVSFGLRPL